MSNYIFRLYQDTLPAANAPVYLGAGPRSLYIVEGDITIETPTAGQNHPSGSAWVGQDAISLVAGAQGAKVWRWELLALNDKSAGELRSAPGSVSTRKLVTEIELADGFEWLMRIDRVGFPKGGIAYTHVHQGPGIRCCLHGEITIDTEGTSHVYQPGESWLEVGQSPVYAPTTEKTETEFIRCLLLPRACKGRSSVRYVLPEDAGKPKRQMYHVFGETFIKLPS
jgi:hypothetical protein